MMLASFDEAEECGGEFVVSGCDAAPLLEFGEEALDAPSVLVGDAIVAVLVLAMAARRDDGLAALSSDDVVEPVGVIGPIGDDLFAAKPVDRGRKRAPCRSAGPVRVSKRTGRPSASTTAWSFGAEAAARAAESLGFRSPLFRRAPAAWAWARMTVASITSHSRSGSLATASNSRSNTPISIQR